MLGPKGPGCGTSVRVGPGSGISAIRPRRTQILTQGGRAWTLYPGPLSRVQGALVPVDKGS
jgi:hypothetical protein